MLRWKYIFTAIIISLTLQFFTPTPIYSATTTFPATMTTDEIRASILEIIRITRLQLTPTQSPAQISPTSTPIPTPTKKITPTPTRILPTPTPTPTSKPQVPTSNLLNSEETYIINAINDYRAARGLSSVSANKQTCDFAYVRAEEISKGFNHDGFRNRINNKTLPYSGYSLVTENIAMNSNYKDVTPRWIASSGHAENMRKNTPYVCVKKYGNYYAYEGWRP